MLAMIESIFLLCFYLVYWRRIFEVCNALESLHQLYEELHHHPQDVYEGMLHHFCLKKLCFNILFTAFLVKACIMHLHLVKKRGTMSAFIYISIFMGMLQTAVDNNPKLKISGRTRFHHLPFFFG